MYDIQLITRSYARIQNHPGYPGCNKYRHSQLNLQWAVWIF